MLQLLPSTLTRSVLSELSKTFLASLMVITFLVIVVLLGEVNLQYDLGGVTCLRLVPYVLPRALAYAFSAACLFAVCAVYGSMAASNELLALKAAGISPFRLFGPPLLFAAVLVPPTVWLMDVANSRAKDGIQRVVMESAPDIAYRSLRCTGSFASENLSLEVASVRGQELIHPTVVFFPPGEDSCLCATAELGQWDRDLHEQQGHLRLVNGSATHSAGYTFRFPDAITFPISYGDVNRNVLPPHHALRELSGAIASQQRRIRQLEAQREQLAVEAAGRNDAASAARARRQGEQLSHERFWLFRLRCFRHRRWSQGFCCLSFTMLGWPLAVLLRRQNVVTLFFLGFSPILLFFYPMEFRLARMSTLPPYSLWLCHAVLILGGLGLFYKVWKH